MLGFGTEVNLDPGDIRGLATFNSRVLNLFIADRSWIDWRDESRLRYAITLFDLNEWMTHEMRRRFNENRKSVLSGQHQAIGEEVRVQFARIRQEYDNESSYGNDPAGQLRWETRINERLAALGEFCRTCKP